MKPGLIKGFNMIRKIRIVLQLLISLAICFPGILPAASAHPDWELKVTTASCPVFLKASESSPILLTLPAGTRMDSYHKNGEWYRVIIDSEKYDYLIIGYVRSENLETRTSEEPEPGEIWPDKPSFFSEMGFTIRLLTGLNITSQGDVKAGINGLLDTANDEMVSLGLEPNYDLHNMASVFELGGDILYNLTPRIAVGLGASHLRGGKVDSISYTSGGRAAGEISADMRFSAVPIRLIVKYTQPLSPLFNLTFAGTPTLYLTKLKYALLNPLWDMESTQILTNSQSLGFSGIIGIEINLGPNAVFYLEGMGRYANLTGFSGNQTIFSESASSQYALKSNGTLYYVEGDRHPGLIVSAETPEGFRSVKKAIFNFSGISLKAGIALRF